MTRRDMLWRGAGAGMTLAACAATLLDRDGSTFVWSYFLTAIGGIVLLVNGKHVATVWRAERGRHRDTAAVIHARRLRDAARDHEPSE